MFSLETVDRDLDPQHCRQLETILCGVAAENVMDLDASREWGYVRRAVRRRGSSTAESDLQRWALVEDGLVVGYISGRLGGGSPKGCGDPARVGSVASDDRDGCAFVSMIVVPSGARGRGCGWRGVREFARLAGKEGATRVGLCVDATGEVTARKRKFERMGFEFDGLRGTASVEELLG